MSAQLLTPAKVFEHLMLAEGSLLIARKGVSERRILGKIFHFGHPTDTSERAELQAEKQINYVVKG